VEFSVSRIFLHFTRSKDFGSNGLTNLFPGRLLTFSCSGSCTNTTTKRLTLGNLWGLHISSRSPSALGSPLELVRSWAKNSYYSSTHCSFSSKVDARKHMCLVYCLAKRSNFLVASSIIVIININNANVWSCFDCAISSFFISSLFFISHKYLYLQKNILQIVCIIALVVTRLIIIRL